MRDTQARVATGRKWRAEEEVQEVMSRLEDGRLWTEVQQAGRVEPIIPLLQSNQEEEERGARAEGCRPGPTGKMRQSGRCCRVSNHGKFGKSHRLKADSH